MASRLRTRLRAGANLAVPTLNLEFATAAGGLDSRVTFTRSTTATRVNASGLIETVAINGPRFDYDPVTLAPKGLLIEEQRTNLLTYSEQFDNAAWTKAGSTVTANATASPDGTVDADKLVESATTGTHQATSSAPMTSGSAQVFSFYAKKAERSKVSFGGGGFGGQGFYVVWDLDAGTLSDNLGGKGSIVAAGNGWYRCVVAFTPSNGNAPIIYVADNSGISYTGDGTSGIYLYGAQLEAGAFATSYIPTVASQVTRTADQTTIDAPNFAPWYNQSEGTFVISMDCPANGVRTEMSVDDGTVNNMFRMRSQVTDPFFIARVGGANVVVLDGGTITANTPYTQANAYAVNNYGVSVNGGAAVTSVSGAVPTVNRMTIGWESAGNYLNGHVRSIQYYPTRLTNTQLQVLST